MVSQKQPFLYNIASEASTFNIGLLYVLLRLACGQVGCGGH